MTNIIFLDIDGVLNHLKEAPDVNAELGIRTPKIHSFCVGLVNLLASDVNAKIVLSTSWREFDAELGHSGSFDVKRFLRSKGLKAPFDSDWHTPVAGHYMGHRGAEINDWLLRHRDVEYWVALDDSPDFSIKNLVLVDPNKGLTVDNIKKAKNFFVFNHEDTD